MRALLARTDERCGICDESIRADEDYIVSVDDEWCHVNCTDQEIDGDTTTGGW